MVSIYLWGLFYFRTHFLPQTVMNNMDVSGMTAAKLEEELQQYSLTIWEKDAEQNRFSEVITGAELGVRYYDAQKIEDLLKEQKNGLWFIYVLNKNASAGQYEEVSLVTYDADSFVRMVKKLKCFDYDFTVKPEAASLSDYIPGKGYEVVPEVKGNELLEDKTKKVLSAAILSRTEEVDLEAEGCYARAAAAEDAVTLENRAKELNSYVNVTITYPFDAVTETLDGSIIKDWLRVGEDNSVTLDTEKVSEYVAMLRKKYDSIFRSRTFLTSYGKEITIEGGDYGWWMNYTKEAEELTAMLLNGESGTRTPVYYQTAASYGEHDYGNTYVEINLTAQHMFFYQDGQLLLESDFVSGNSSKNNGTPVGVYGITYKERDATLVGENYETPVSYWMPFNQNIGLHDASWRKEFGGNIYLTSGSHGCINLPPDVAEKLYGMISKGDAVICYELPGTEPVVVEQAPTAGQTPTESQTPAASQTVTQ